MRAKEARCVITFPSTTAAMAMEGYCEKAGLPGRLIPVPRTITAGCGLCWSAPLESRKALEDGVMEAHITISGIYTILL